MSLSFHCSEQMTLELLKKFKSKLSDLKDKALETDAPSTSGQNDVENVEGDDWLSHELKFEDMVPVLAKDASTKKDDWYDVSDPRNALNKRKRGDDRRNNDRRDDRYRNDRRRDDRR